MGGAGTGKTTSLLRELEVQLATHPLGPGQRVLALTFMHGARQRLAERLAVSCARRHYECMTLDRFAWEVCRRWRSRLRSGSGSARSESNEPDFEATCERAGQLLASPDVVHWVAARFPVIVLDEFQDCAPVRLSLAQRLHGHVTMLVAADDFQNLNSCNESPGVVWLRRLGVCEELTLNRRTTDAHLIAAAHALRAGLPLTAEVSSSFKLFGVPSAPVAASFISQTMAPSRGKDVVVLSPAGTGKSRWVDKVIDLVRTNQYGKQRVGPLPIKWEKNASALEQARIDILGVAQGNGQILASAILSLPRSPVAMHLSRWVQHQRSVQGRTDFGADQVRLMIKRAVQHVRSFGSSPQSGYRALTIHQAKNREFSVVLVLWPFEVVGDQLLARRWLYNAITRAKRRAIVIVHDPRKSRLAAPPFALP